MTEALLLASVVFGPLAHGCTEPWSLALLELLLLSMALRRREASSSRAGHVLFACCLLVLGMGLLQWLHPHPIDGPSSRFPFTASLRETGKALVLWSSFAALLWAAPRSLSRPGAKTRLAWALVLVAVFVAVVGAIQLSQGNTMVYGLRPAAYNRSPFGPYFNRGHAASFMAMCWCVGLGLLWSRQASKWRLLGEGVRPSDFFASQVTLAVLLAVIASGLVLARNRGSILGLALAACGIGFWACGALKSRPAVWAMRLGLVLVPVALAGAVLAWPEKLGFPRGFGELSVTWRLDMYRGALQLFRDFPVWGIGLGAVVSAFPAYKAGSVAGIVDHVHSDWLELPLQIGMLGTLACAAGLAFLAARFWRRARTRQAEDLRLDAGALAGVLVFIGHGAIDFSFQIPANAVVFLVLLCWLASSSEAPGSEGEVRNHRHRSSNHRWARRSAKAACLGLMFLALLPLPGYWYAWRSQGLPPKPRLELLEKAYAWDPQPKLAYAIGLERYKRAAQDPRGETPAMREALTFVRRALREEPVNPYLNLLQGTYLDALGRKADAAAMLALPR
ncbi:MAG: O-antigen ligase family protein [Elusimicrobia bacterium]|nr:O-antigen ligase family protein [Elusimicrobiota bacterium]